MEVRIEKKRFYTDQERYKWCRKCKLSGMPVTTFARKVFQTSGSYAGVRYSSKLFSLVQTCKINNVNVERYFKYVLENINSKDIEDLLPYSEKISKELK